MVSEIMPGLFRMEVPLPNNPLRALNSYLIMGKDRNLMVDTGFNLDECREAQFANLKALDVDMAKTDIFVTHLHADHFGLASTLASDTSTVYFNREETMRMTHPDADMEHFFGRTRDVYVSNGFPPDVLDKATAGHPGRRFSGDMSIDFHQVDEGDEITVGDYAFQVLSTPGHTPGHTCLYEPAKKLLIAGDLILEEITPNIAYWLDMENPLKQFFDSLDRIATLELDLTLTGHLGLITDHRKRVKELHEHHEDRLAEVITALTEGDKNAYQVAPYIEWDVGFGEWDVFPVIQKWFAFGETLAHLMYLEAEGKIASRREGSQVVYALK